MIHHHDNPRHARAPFAGPLDPMHQAIGRRGRSDDGFAPPGGRRGGRRGGFGGFGGGRVFGHGELKFVLLALIAEKARHGYELIRSIEEMFDGAYSPSPGAVYPTLTMLEEMDCASVEESDNGRKCYRITDTGREYLEAHRDEVDAAMQGVQAAARMYARMAAPMAVREALHALRHALRERAGAWSSGEARRVLDIIKRAAEEIARGKPD